MKSIVLLICSVIATTLFAQPTTLDMKERYYMKGEVSEINRKKGSNNPLMATQDENGNIYYVGYAVSDEVRQGAIGKCDPEGNSATVGHQDLYNIYDCILVGDKIAYVGNLKVLLSDADNLNKSKILKYDAIGQQKILFNPNTQHLIAFGVDKTQNPMRGGAFVIDTETFENIKGAIVSKSYGYFPIHSGEQLKNDFAAISNNNIALWAYNTQDNFSDYSNAQIAILGIYDKAGYDLAKDLIDVKKYLNNFVSDFRPYTSYENKAYEQVNKVQWAISGIHPKEDGTFLITASFIHWTTTASGKAGYQKGILGVEYDFTQSNSITDTWVTFPWAVKEASSMQEKMEIKPYYTHYIGENDIAVFDQETGHLFAINSDLDACKSSDELGTCGAKSKELQKWLINNRVIAKIEPNGYFLNFVGSNTPHNRSEQKSIHLICVNGEGNGFKIIKFNP